MLSQIEVFIPTALAIMSLALFTDKTRKLCYTTVALCILAEVIPTIVNPIALVACVACLAALVLTDVIRHNSHFKHYFSSNSNAT